MNLKSAFCATLAAPLLFALPAPRPAAANPYPKMAPVERYMMPRADEISLARSAAPPSVSEQATVLVLTRQGYVTAAQGTNHFVCFVERSWDSPFGSAKFWNPSIRGANCLNAAAARTVLPLVKLLAQLALAGHSEAEIEAGVKSALAAHRLPPLEANAVSYMLSKRSYLTNSGGNTAHVMFYLPAVTAGELGADLPGSPIGFAGQLAPDPITVVIVETRKWSDGSPAS